MVDLNSKLNSSMAAGPYQIRPIAFVESCYRQKFGIPRQPGLSPSSLETIRFIHPFDRPEAVIGLEQTSHIWVQFIFHATEYSEGTVKVRPPRLGGNKELGVFATRSPHRPNALGLSVVKLEEINLESGVQLMVRGGDFLSGTPVVDVKPYVPYADAIEGAQHGFAQQQPRWIEVGFSDLADSQICEYQKKLTAEGVGVDLREMVGEMLRQDPRPAYQRNNPTRMYATHIFDFNLRWRYIEKGGVETLLVHDLN